MTFILLKDFADIKLVADDPEERFITSGVSWEQYEFRERLRGQNDKSNS